jgi:hypothetical protein
MDIEERVVFVEDYADLQQHLTAAGDRLVALEVSQGSYCLFDGVEKT